MPERNNQTEELNLKELETKLEELTSKIRKRRSPREQALIDRQGKVRIYIPQLIEEIDKMEKMGMFPKNLTHEEMLEIVVPYLEKKYGIMTPEEIRERQAMREAGIEI